MTVFEFKTDTFESRQFNLQHVNCGAEISVTSLTTSQSSIYSYPSPGCVLYQWSTLSKKILNQLDCLKLVPCSESLGSISIDKNLSVGRCQVIYYGISTSKWVRFDNGLYDFCLDNRRLCSQWKYLCGNVLGLLNCSWKYNSYTDHCFSTAWRRSATFISGAVGISIKNTSYSFGWKGLSVSHQPVYRCRWY